MASLYHWTNGNALIVTSRTARCVVLTICVLVVIMISILLLTSHNACHAQLKIVKAVLKTINVRFVVMISCRLIKVSTVKRVKKDPVHHLSRITLALIVVK